MTKITNADDPLFEAIGKTLRQWVSNADGKINCHGRSPLVPPLHNARQYGKDNCQYNQFGDGTLNIRNGHCFEAGGNQYFDGIPSKVVGL